MSLLEGNPRAAQPAGRSHQQRSEVRDGMRIDWDVPITMDDGLVLRADVFRPVTDGRYPVILSYGPYAKGLAFQDGYPSAWERMAEQASRRDGGSSNLYQSWEVVDPEKWVPHGYACVRVDSRGCGCSPGFIDHWSPRETKDFHDCIEWAGVQPWSNGKVGLNGISYYAINQWHVASLQPPHLAAMCIWEGCADFYREMTHHGGILCTFPENWYDMQVKTVQYGAGERGKRSRVHGELVCGPQTLSEAELAKNRSDFGREIREHPLDDALSQGALADLVEGEDAVPVGRELGRPAAASARQFRRLRARGKQGQVARGARHRALDAFLYRLRARASAQVLRPFPAREEKRLGQAAERAAAGAPYRQVRASAPRTNGRSSAPSGPSSISIPQAARSAARSAAGKAVRSFDAMGDGVTFLTEPLAQETEITGPSALKLFVSSSTSDADIFVGAARVHRRPQGGRVPGRHRSAHADRSGLAARLAPQARQEAVDALPALSHPRPEAAAEARRDRRTRHRDLADLRSWCRPATAWRSPIRGKDYVYGGPSGGKLSNFKNELTGCGPFLHDDPRDRPPAIFGGVTSLHFGGGTAAVPAAAGHPGGESAASGAAPRPAQIACGETARALPRGRPLRRHRKPRRGAAIWRLSVGRVPRYDAVAQR